MRRVHRELLVRFGPLVLLFVVTLAAFVVLAVVGAWPWLTWVVVVVYGVFALFMVMLGVTWWLDDVLPDEDETWEPSEWQGKT